MTIPTLTDLDTMPDVEVLRRAAGFLRDDLDGPPDDVEAAVLALLDAGGTAAGRGDPADHRAVTAAVAQLARAILRDEYATADRKE